MAYTIITKGFVWVEYFDNIFNLEFRLVYLRSELSVNIVKGGNWVFSSLPVQIRSKIVV